MTQVVEIERLGVQGDGVAPGPIFVPLTLPGEQISGRVEGDRIPAPEIIRPSASRQIPPCPAFGRCGGCALQHASDDFLAGWKRDLVAEALARAGVSADEIRPTITSPPRSRRRATFAGRRTKKGVQIGFHERFLDRIVQIQACELVDPVLLEGMPAMDEAVRLGASRKGEIRLTATKTEGGLDLAVSMAKAQDPQLLEACFSLADRWDLARLAWNGEVLAQRRPPHQRFGAALVAPPPGGFLQATREGEAALVAAMREAVGTPRRALDLFAGSGTFTLSLADLTEVTAVEADAAALYALAAGWRAATGLKLVKTEVRNLFRKPLLSDELSAADVVVIDPPRAGAAAQMAELAQSGPPVIASISCDPGTFARDARTLIEGGYRLEWVQPVDQFLWSPHVEIASKFSR